jgi:hypothetical protein
MFVCLLICFVVLFRFYSLFVFIYCLCYVTVVYQFFFESICCPKRRLSGANPGAGAPGARPPPLKLEKI